MSRIFLSPPHMSGRERTLVMEVFDSNWIAPLGEMVDGFERDLQDYTGAKHAAALSSGTAAIHLALVMLGVQPGDYVICQSLTFSATANPIRYLGATPVFVDSETETWNMCPEALEAAVVGCMEGSMQKAGRPKAIIPVHLYGMPAKMHEIRAVAAKYDIPILEDAAEALGSHIRDTMCGNMGEMSILSFNGNKIITTSGGGALLSNDEAVVSKARFLATQARDPAPHYQHSEIGYNYRMSNVLAGIGRGQMQSIDDRVAQRRYNHSCYHTLLGTIPGISFLHEPEGFFSNRWLTTIQVDPEKTNGITRETIRLALEKENIESRPLWKPMHLQPAFDRYPCFGNNVAEKLFNNGLCLPSGSDMSDEDLERVGKCIAKVAGIPPAAL